MSARDLELVTRAADFAARAHAMQHRKGLAEEPYVNHLTEVAALLAGAIEDDDVELIAAAYLHDTLEDTATRYEDLDMQFGANIARLVAEVTDDKSLPKTERKRLQEEKAPHKSPRAKLVKIADKTSNLRSIAKSPPVGWDLDRQRQYFDWAARVVAGCRGTNATLERWFDEAHAAGLAALAERR